MNTVKQERSGWRDESISRRHREWGWDCPAIDIDFLLLNYSHGQPTALVEYKHEKVKSISPSHPSFKALIALGTMAKLPVFCVRYSDNLVEYIVIPLNEIASTYVGGRTIMSELQWVSMLYRINKDRIPNHIKNKIVNRSAAT